MNRFNSKRLFYFGTYPRSFCGVLGPTGSAADRQRHHSKAKQRRECNLGGSEPHVLTLENCVT